MLLQAPFILQKRNSFFQWGLTLCKADQPLRGMGLQEKEAQKDCSIQEICLERAYS